MSLKLDLELQRMGLRDGITTDQLVEAAQQCKALWPTGRLFKNAVGNLAVDVEGEYVAWIDLSSGGVTPVD